MPTCALCLNEVSKLSDSHIISDVLWRHTGLFDGKQRHEYFVPQGSTVAHEGNIQSGLWEPMLCAVCEGEFAVWEGYAASLLQQKYSYDWLKGKELPVDYIKTGLEYKSLKMFVLSLFWRMSVSKAHMFYSGFDLGEYHNDTLRTLLHNGWLPDFWQYGCTLTIFSEGEMEIMTPALVFPVSPNCSIAYVIIGNALLGMFHGFAFPPEEAFDYLLQQDGSWRIEFDKRNHHGYMPLREAALFHKEQKEKRRLIGLLKRRLVCLRRLERKQKK